MDWNAVFFIENILLGFGLAMDAFSVSLANGLNEPCMKKGKVCGVAGMFAFFQFIMPLIGWFFVHTAAQHFKVFEKFIPYIALVLLCFIGGKMIYESLHECEEGDDCCCEKRAISFGGLIVQGVATSIDALSVGFTIADYDGIHAIVSGLVIAAVTFVICLGGIYIGKKAGTKLANKAGILGGSVLIFIGLEIFITGII